MSKLDINLSNINVYNDEIKITFLFKNIRILSKDEVYLVNSNGEKINSNIQISEYNFDNNDDKNSAKVEFKFKLKENNLSLNYYSANKNITYTLNILDNKDSKIYLPGNAYKIFTKEYVVNLCENGFEICKRRLFDKFKYELSKQIYGIKKYHKLFIYRFLKFKQKYYLLNDRFIEADDNSEVMFEYINKNIPDIAKKSYYVLDKNSKAMDRLKRIGKVVKYGSFKHKFLFINAKFVISSHASYYGNCFNPFSKEEMDIYKDITNRKFAFLQHGVTMNDVRKYHNYNLITPDIYITTLKREFEHIKSVDYMYDNNNIICSGLPRFDRLINNESKVILISPTWRTYFTNEEYDIKSDKIKFNESEYYKTYCSILSNSNIINSLKENGYKIKFLLHPMLKEYKKYFEKYENEYIEIYSSDEIRYVNLFNECSMLITDYSSIHFDVAFMKKPIIYYQFDKSDFFGNHYKPGYYDYEKDGYGKVIDNEKELITELIYNIENNCKNKEEYISKIEDSFMNLDYNNCKRVFDKVLELSNKNDIDYRFNDVH